MKTSNYSQLERTFLTKTLEKHQRLDGRSIDETRDIRIQFYSHLGSVSVSLGATHVISRVSSQIIKPKETRANIGLLRIHLDMSNIPLITLDHWKHSDFGHQLNQILERNICQSECIDLESLCIIAGEFVWALKIDLSVQNSDGNILDCANIAALCSLCHYRLPVVSIHGSDIRIFSEKERYPQPLRILFYPINVTFAFLAKGSIVVIDPSSDEERQMDGFIAVSSNQRQEICGIQMGGSLGLQREQIDLCQKLAYKKAYQLTELIDEQIENYFKTTKPLMKTQSSVVATSKDDDDSSDEHENERRTKMKPIFDEDISLNLITNMNTLSINADEISSNSNKSNHDFDND